MLICALVKNCIFVVGSGSTYIYGHCDATYKAGMTKEECFTFVSNGLLFFLILFFVIILK